MDTRSDKDKEFDKAQAVDRLSQDDKDKMSLIRMMMAKEKESMKESDEDKKHLDMIAYYEFGADSTSGGFDKLGDAEKEEARKFMADKKSVKEGLPKDYWDKKIDAKDEDQDGKVDESYATVVNKIKKSGKSEKAAKAIAGAVASYKAKGGGKGPTAKQK